MGWTIGYFGLQSVANGFYVTVVSLILSIPVALAAYRASTLAGLLMTPLVLWQSYALTLSWTVWRLNV
jgi:tryptophan-rich sensory protein